MKKHLLFWLLWLLPFALSAQVRDSAEIVSDSQEQSSPYYYVNASSLTLRALPYAGSAAVATISGASRVEVVWEHPDGWSEVKIDKYRGWVRSDYLVATQQEVTAESVDWSLVAAAGGVDYSHVSAVKVTAAAPRISGIRAPTVRNAAPKPSSSPKVYICSNGRTEVYHNSESCSAMNRCTYATKVASTGEAREIGLRECMKCF